MTDKVFYIVAVYFLVGAIGTFLANKGKDHQVKKQRWLKYASYFIIVNGIVILLVFKPALFKYLAILIAGIGCFEISMVAIGKVKTSLFIFALLLYIFIGAGFVWFAFSTNFRELLFVYVLVFSFDGFSQIFGQFAGRKKLSPGISPNKTIEGFLGGLLTTIFTAELIRRSIDASWKYTLLLSFLLCLSCLAGDLAASWYKRKAGVKDYSNIIPGHGGILDRFDSLLGAGVFYILFLHLYTFINHSLG